MMGDADLDLKLLRRLGRLEDEEKELSEHKRAKLASQVDLPFMGRLLSQYTGTQSLADTQIYDILQVIERRLGISLKIAAPLIFGPRSAEYYKDLHTYGRTLQRILNPNEVLKFLDKERLVKTSYIMCRGPREDLYDPRFILRLFLSMVQRGTELKCASFIAHGALQFVFAALSLRDAELRSIAYVILQRFLSLTNELSMDDFPEQSLISYFLRLVKYGVKSPNQRLPSPISRFLADSVVVLTHPTFPIFKPLMASFIQRPTVNLEMLSEFRKFFFSTSLANHKMERKWILNVCAMSIHEPGDYGLLEKSSIIESCLAAFTSPICNFEARKKILGILNSCLRHESCARDLFLRHNLFTWLAVVVRHPAMTKEDVLRIEKLRDMLRGHIHDWLEKSPNPIVRALIKMK
ncbi:NopRA1 domain-containing protein [Aphelenchoides bicaudatus]|nr:NopRA1 domain-containing protein [Aphelenchoides bicaudatus]